jgi:cell division GTPase FtsZ
MRVLLVGVGGAGCRIADSIYDHDINSPIRCTEGIAVDRDAEALNALIALPRENRIFYQPLDPSQTAASLPSDLIITKLQNLNPGDIDAIIVCAGLGGELARGIQPFVRQVKESMFEPVFGLFTVPCAKEGDNILGLAADEFDSLLPEMDGTILFDNDIFPIVRPIEEGPEGPASEGIRKRISLRKTMKEIEESPLGYGETNTTIAKQINLLLHAGETGDKPGMETGEVALDAGEILNTMKGMGCIAIGYARDTVSVTNPDIINRLRPATSSLQESHQKAQRLVEIARRAIDEGMSIACDPSMAEKALILIAGPPHELSMRGYMTIRHWIDRTIRGQEVRSGDYPVKNTRYIAVLVVLAGLEKVTKINEIRRIRDTLKKLTGL